ncbi:cytosine permease [Glaciihabitans sp. UYNi722]|uniref:purine-cytosine permease family protein n=1 Tax=Glaciihabitans sp. UYNi722 TaxID=3156344 RepID=UPI0033962894
MANHDDAGERSSAATPSVPTGPRRSTFAPPPAVASRQPDESIVSDDERDYDDDALADALADEAVRLGYSGPIQIIRPVTAVARVPLAELPAPSGPSVQRPEPDPADAPTPEPPAAETDDPPAELSAAVPSMQSPAAFPSPPARTSLPDDELVRSLSEESRQPNGIASVFDKFEEHLRLRQQEARTFQEWENTVQAIGTPEALDYIEEVKTGFIEVIPEVPVAVEPVPAPVPPTNPPPLVEPPQAYSRFAPQPAASSDFDSLVTGSDEEASDVPEEPVVSAPAHLPFDEIASVATSATPLSIFSLEVSGSEPTPLDYRVGRSTRLFWLWFATNSSVLSIAFGGALFSLGMSLRQAIVSAFIGVAISFIPLGLGTLAGKWSGQPTMVISRATFGLVGNIVPAVLAVIVRLFWGAVLLWIIAASAGRILTGAKLGGSFTELQLTLLAMAVGFVIALVIAFLGYRLFARIQLVLTIVSAILLVAVVVATWPSVSISKALTVGDGQWILVVTGVVLVFSFIGLAWASSSADLARYQRPSSSGAASMLSASFGATLPGFLLIAYGALLAASDPTVAKGLVTNPLDTIGDMLPAWFPIPLLAAAVLSLLSGVVLSIYSAGFALQSAGLRLPREWGTVLVGAVLFAAALVMTFTVDDLVPIFRDIATTLAVPVAAWVGIFAAEMMIRRRRFDALSLLARGGAYPAVNWVNLSMLVVASAIGLGFTTATVNWLGWEGYLFSAFRVPLNGEFAGTDIGVLVALVLGLLTPFVAGVPAIRRQELDRA